MSLHDTLATHVPTDADEAESLATIRAFVRRHRNPFDRAIAEGHLTGSAIVVDPGLRATLLVFHRKLLRWLQPGGHAEPSETDGRDVAVREAREETGLRGLTLHPAAPAPLDVDVHTIPARPGEPEHLHLDLRYLLVAHDTRDVVPDVAEVSQCRWVGLDELDALSLDPGLERALAKVRAIATARA